ncbi:hypothetical protein FKM82_025660 [Ascaphus truei]
MQTKTYSCMSLSRYLAPCCFIMASLCRQVLHSTQRSPRVSHQYLPHRRYSFLSTLDPVPSQTLIRVTARRVSSPSPTSSLLAELPNNERLAHWPPWHPKDHQG